MGNPRNGKRKRDNGKDHGEARAQQQHQSSQPQHTPIPDTFSSYREYCGLWAPLCLEETRAQLLSDAISEIPYWKSKPEKHPVRVRLHPLRADVGGSSESMGLQIKDILTSDYKDRSFLSTDVVLLAKRETYIWEASKGMLADPSSSNQYGLVGHVEYARRSMEGITIRVSRDLWTELAGKKNTTEMVLLKIGSNITSLREFTALCHMDSIPLSDYILGAKMNSKKNSNPSMPSVSKKKEYSNAVHSDYGDGETGGNDDVDQLAKEKRAKKAILSSIGGSSALGKGFATYASQKFNLSQLGAISASAQEYGEGGFTLIKGPPGTGKVRSNFSFRSAQAVRIRIGDCAGSNMCCGALEHSRGYGTPLIAT